MTVSFLTYADSNHRCGVWVEVDGFNPGAHELLIVSSEIPSWSGSIVVEADGTGVFASIAPAGFTGHTWNAGDTNLVVTVGGFSSSPLTVQF